MPEKPLFFGASPINYIPVKIDNTSGSNSIATMSPSMALFIEILSGMRMSCPTLSEPTHPSAELNLFNLKAPYNTF